MAQIISWDATLVAVVAGLAVLTVLTLFTRDVGGAKEEALEKDIDIFDEQGHSRLSSVPGELEKKKR